MIDGMDSFLGVVASIAPNQQVALLVLDHRSGNTGAVKIWLK